MTRLFSVCLDTSFHTDSSVKIKHQWSQTPEVNSSEELRRKRDKEEGRRLSSAGQWRWASPPSSSARSKKDVLFWARFIKESKPRPTCSSSHDSFSRTSCTSRTERWR
ncbi:unnamed protein product [Pleuronectes platessa]|uniref:Uncharacterized protein n=1 Tax=Pleuronectes platessa TaxID=8262 RepID=A0A9N7YDC9_PLEPL|nr:unnamed protein product [Pleuronectes platessa]